jgi:Fe(3+) dicitrate transport protein
MTVQQGTPFGLAANGANSGSLRSHIRRGALLGKTALSGVLLMAPVAGFAADAAADDASITDSGDPVIIVNGIVPEERRLIPGSFDVVDRIAIEERNPLTLRDQLLAIPGINVVEEDAGGLSLNIGIRGLNPRRSTRMLLMEDGVPIALAPYGDPASHYAPPIERVERIEVVRGSGQILYGPQTVGGMINFVTTPIPTDGPMLRGEARGGTRGFYGVQASAGTGTEKASFLIEATARGGDGIRESHGFDLWEVVGKGRLAIGADHELRVRASYYEESSNITESMLGAREFALNPRQAPTGAFDRFLLDRTHLQANHIWTPSETVRLTTTAYWVRTFRASYRMISKPGAWSDDADARGRATGFSTLDRCFNRRNPEPGTGGSATNQITPEAAEQCGGRWRPREFTHYGIETRMDADHNLFGLENTLTAGVRWHQEDIQRDQFRDPDPAIRDFAFARTLTGGAHREDVGIDVQALSGYLQNSITAGAVTVTGGVRVEHVENTTLTRRADGREVGVEASRSDTTLLPGLGAVWQVGAGTEIFAGVHLGFAPPRPDRDVGSAIAVDIEPEQSTNWELGFRSQAADGVSLSGTLFQTDFRQIVIGSAAGRFINGGRSRQAGLELAGRIDTAPMTGSDHNFWLQSAYTFVPTAKFLNTSDVALNRGDGGVIGAPCVTGDGCRNGNGIIAGNRLPYAPRHTVSLSVGYRHPAGVEARFGLDHRSSQQPDSFASVLDTTINAVGCSDRDCSGLAGTIPAVTLFNAGLSVTPGNGRVSFFATAWNLFDKRYLASRRDGMVLGNPQTIVGGVRLRY